MAVMEVEQAEGRGGAEAGGFKEKDGVGLSLFGLDSGDQELLLAQFPSHCKEAGDGRWGDS